MIKETILTLAIISTFGMQPASAAGNHAEKGAKFFAEVDTNKDGGITEAEMNAHMQARFAKSDTNGDGMLDSAEMLAGAVARGSGRAAHVLKRHDADGDGTLNNDELSKFLSSRAGRRGAHMLKRMDANGDQKISFEEMQQGRGKGPVFAKLDTDKNGVLSAEEFAKSRHHGKKH